MVVRSQFRCLPPVVGSHRFCSLRHASNGYLPRVGDNVISLVTRESYERCMHLLQHELQVLHSVVVISIVCSAPHSNIISDSLITPAKNASVFFDYC